MSEHAERFTRLRPLLFTIAYEILGSATEADDVLQESYLRWADVDLTTVRDTRPYLVRIVARQALNALRAGARRREDYVGPWLPEPLLRDEHDPADDVVLAESVSTAMLVVLESLSPEERAVFVLREVFGTDHAEIAAVLDRPVATVRQIAHRARGHVHARRRRFEPADDALSARVTAEFLAAAATGDLDRLLGMLAPDVVWTADSGGRARASRRPVHGADKVARLILGLARGALAGARLEPAVWNSAPALVQHVDDRLAGVTTMEVVDGRIVAIYVMRNPDKLGSASVRRTISR